MDARDESHLVLELQILGFEGYENRILEKLSTSVEAQILIDKVQTIIHAHYALRLTPDELINMVIHGTKSIELCNSWIQNFPRLCHHGFSKDQIIEMHSRNVGCEIANGLISNREILSAAGFSPKELFLIVNHKKRGFINFFSTLLDKNQQLLNQGLSHQEIVKLFIYPAGLALSSVVIGKLSYSKQKTVDKNAILQLLDRQKFLITGKELETLWVECCAASQQEVLNSNTLFSGKKRGRSASFADEELSAANILASLGSKHK